MAKDPEPLIQTLMSIGDDYYAAKAVAERIEAIEARQRANRQHDPDCPLLVAEHMQERTGAYVERPACTCWLFKTKET